MSVVSAVNAMENFDAANEFMVLPSEIDSDQSIIDGCTDCVSEASASSSDSFTSAEESPSICDSGFADIDALPEVDLRCLESLLVWPSQDEAEASCDEANCMGVVGEHFGFEDYIDDIYLHRLSIEDRYHVPKCLENQPELTPADRSTLVKWITDILREFKLSNDTLYLTVSVLDRVLDVMQISRDCAELLGITCLLVSCKQNEVNLPEIRALLAKCSESYTRGQVRQLELIVLMVICFDLLAPTTQHFLEYFAFHCITAAVEEEHVYKLKMCRDLGLCLLELTLQAYQFCQFKPSLLALCVWKAALEYLKTCDGDYIPPDMCINQVQYDLCQAELHVFIDSFRQKRPDLSSLYKEFDSLYRSK